MKIKILIFSHFLKRILRFPEDNNQEKFSDRFPTFIECKISNERFPAYIKSSRETAVVKKVASTKKYYFKNIMLLVHDNEITVIHKNT